MAFDPPQVGVRFTADDDQVTKAIQTLVGELRSIRKEEKAAKKSTDRLTISQEQLGRSMRRAALQVVALVGGFELMRRASSFVVDTAREFQQLEQRLISLTGSELAAARALELITEFARKTPFEIQNLVEAFTQLSAVGLSPTEEQLRDLGNFAAAFGRDFNDLISGIIRAAQGGTERLREGFGLPLEKEGNRIRVTFRGVTHETEATTGALIEMFQEISRAHFGDAMERQMTTLGGATSNLQDTVSLLARDIGEEGLTAELTRVVRKLDDTIASSDELGEVLGESVAAGANAAADSLIFLIEHAEEAVIVLQALGGAVVARGIVALVTRLVAAAAAAGGLGTALVGLLGGPAGAVLTLASAIAVPLVLNLERANVEVEKLVEGIREFNRERIATEPLEIAAQIREANELIDETQQKIDDLREERRATGGLLSRDVVDPDAAEDAAELEKELERLEERRKQLVLALDEQAKARQAAEDAEDEADLEERRKAIASIVAGLERERDALQFTERELVRKKLAEQGASEDTIDHALAIYDEAAALREQEEALKATQAQLERLPDVEEALLEAQGDTVGALRRQLQDEYDELIAALLSRADFAGVQLVQKLINTRLARARLQELQEEFETARASLAAELERIEIEHESGAITSEEAQERVRAAYIRTRDTIGELIPLLKAAAEATGDPAAIARVKTLENEYLRLGQSIDRIGSKVQEFGAQARQSLQRDLVSFLSEGIQQADNLGDAFAQLADDVIDSLLRIASTIAAESIFSAIFPSAAEGAADGGLVAGGGQAGQYAEGGPVRGSGGPTSDTVPAMLSPGEYVVRASAVQRVGVQTLDAINEGMRTPTFVRRGGHYFEHGGLVEATTASRSTRADGRRRSGESPPSPVINVEVHAPASDPRLVARHVMEELTEGVQHNRDLRALFQGGG